MLNGAEVGVPAGSQLDGSPAGGSGSPDSLEGGRRRLGEALVRLAARQPERAPIVAEMLDFVRRRPDCFCRSCVEGHLTGSAWLLAPGGREALLLLHRKLQRWLQPGGHADGDEDLLRVALREAEEESGIAGIYPLSAEIFDVDIHEIPARPGEPRHRHFDVRFLLQAPRREAAVSDESEGAAWVRLEEIAAEDGPGCDESVRRMARLSLQRPEPSHS